MGQGNIPDDKVDEVISRVNIVDIVSPYVNLKKAGRNYLGLCPFHKEKTPSFTVSPDKQMYYCFGCGEGGSAVSFLMKIDSMTFPEAIRHLASRYGVALPERPRTPEERQKASLWSQMIGINRLAERHFAENLTGPRGEPARRYLQKRGISESAVRIFRIGYAPDEWQDLKDYLQRSKAPLKLAEQAGLLVAREDGSCYDRFRGRLMFSVADVNDRAIAFGGRLLGAGEPKYLNSPESPVYVKGRNLYGLNVTRESIRKKGYAIVVEGYLDLISLWSAGVTHVVATLGTALTREHVELVRRYTNRVAVVFDPDEAGRKALGRSLELFLSGSVQVQAVVLPDGYDPDDFVRAFGPARFEEIVEKAGPAVEYYIDSVFGNRGGIQKDRELLKEAVRFISRIESAVERNLFIRRIAERLGVDEGLLKKEVSALIVGPSDTASPRFPIPSGTGSAVDNAEMNLIRMMLVHPEKVQAVHDENVLMFFATGALKDLGGRIEGQILSGRTVDPAVFVENLDDGALKRRFLSAMVERESPEPATLDREFYDTVLRIKKKWYREKKRILNLQLRQAQEQNDSVLCDDLLRAVTQLISEEKHL